MADAIEPSLWQRALHTPVSDALRGDLSGRLDVKRHIATATLDPELKSVVLKVVRTTRLWRSEKIQVADELMAHFADGLAAGETPAALIQQFGDPRAAAQLIRRAMKRKRSILWKAFNALRWLCVAMIAFYVLSGIVFLVGEPSVKTNYLADLNAGIDEVPVEQRAWTHYARVIPKLDAKDAYAHDTSTKWFFDQEPGDKRFAEMTAWLTERQKEIDVLRQASALPTLGFVYGPGGSAYDKTLFPDVPSPETDGRPPMLLSLMMPHLNHVRQLANVLVADARVARSQNDAARWMADIEAVESMAGQLGADAFLVQSLVAVGMRDMACREAAKTLAGQPKLLSNDQLKRLAHRFAVPSTVSELVSLKYERQMFYDVIQRLYTDDGNGDGRLTREGLSLLNQFSRPEDSALMYTREGTAMLSPLLMASRKEVVELYEEYMDAAELDLNTPAWRSELRVEKARIPNLPATALNRYRYGVLFLLTPSFTNFPRATERYLGMRDGLLISIAAEAHRRQHDGRWPASLAELSPMLLPVQPIDRITGGPLKYQIVDDRPLVYSVGVDRDDDGGRLAKNAHGVAASWNAAEWYKVANQHAADGDWVLTYTPDPE